MHKYTDVMGEIVEHIRSVLTSGVSLCYTYFSGEAIFTFSDMESEDAKEHILIYSAQDLINAANDTSIKVIAEHILKGVVYELVKDSWIITGD